MSRPLSPSRLHPPKNPATPASLYDASPFDHLPTAVMMPSKRFWTASTTNTTSTASSCSALQPSTATPCPLIRFSAANHSPSSFLTTARSEDLPETSLDFNALHLRAVNGRSVYPNDASISSSSRSSLADKQQPSAPAADASSPTRRFQAKLRRRLASILLSARNAQRGDLTRRAAPPQSSTATPNNSPARRSPPRPQRPLYLDDTDECTTTDEEEEDSHMSDSDSRGSGESAIDGLYLPRSPHAYGLDRQSMWM